MKKVVSKRTYLWVVVVAAISLLCFVKLGSTAIHNLMFGFGSSVITGKLIEFLALEGSWLFLIGLLGLISCLCFLVLKFKDFLLFKS